MNYKAALEKALIQNDKVKAYTLTKSFLEDSTNILPFYETIIPSILNAIDCDENDFECIFKEHKMSAIMRALVEMSYEVIIKNKHELTPSKHVLVSCLKDETHELGAVIGANLFEYFGFKTTYTGPNTPHKTIIGALEVLDIDYVILSVTNAYNIVEMNKLIKRLKKDYQTIKVFGAGRGAILHKNHLALDGIITSSDDILSLIKKEDLTCSPLK